MAAKDILFDIEARKKLFDGAEKVYKAVSATFGPKGLNITIQRPYGAPQVVGDGVTVAKEIELEDQFENLGAELVIEAADRTNQDAGDATTLTVILAYEIVKEGLKQINNGENARVFRDELKEATNKIVEYLKPLAKPVKTKEAMANVATISSANLETGKMIAEAFDRVTKDGVVTVDLGNSPETEVEFKEGLTVPSGFIVPHFVTDPETMKVELENPYILVTDQSLSGADEILELLKLVHQDNKTILIIANDVTSSALGTLILNKQQGFLKPLAIKAPKKGGEGMLEDIALATGATFISSKLGLDIKKTTLENLGKAEKIIADKNETVILGAKGNEKLLQGRIKQLRKQIEDSDSSFEEEKYKERLSRLSGGIAVIYAGGNSDTEIRERRLRIEDAINATRAAIEEGIIPGGGVPLFHARAVLQGTTVGEKILSKILETPIKKLLENAGVDPHPIIYKLNSGTPNQVYDVVTNKFVDAFAKGVVDPLKVIRLALENAISVASSLLTTGASIIELPKDDPKQTV